LWIEPEALNFDEPGIISAALTRETAESGAVEDCRRGRLTFAFLGPRGKPANGRMVLKVHSLLGWSQEQSKYKCVRDQERRYDRRGNEERSAKCARFNSDHRAGGITGKPGDPRTERTE
jgi:hypothetical protein